MKCQGKFKYKGLHKRNGGSFTNNQGQVINYKDSYSLKVDEITSDGIYERQFKLATDSPLVNQLLNVKLYDEITLEFNILLFNSRVSLIPVSLIK